MKFHIHRDPNWTTNGANSYHECRCGARRVRRYDTAARDAAAKAAEARDAESRRVAARAALDAAMDALASS